MEIQELKRNDADKNKEINFLKQQIEELQQSNAPETCSQLRNQGVTRTQDIFIDSDGVNQGTLPFKMFGPFWSVWCKMALAEVGMSLP